MIKKLRNALRRRVRVEIECACGPFIPGAYRLGGTSRYACRRCGLTIRLTTFRGEVSW